VRLGGSNGTDLSRGRDGQAQGLGHVNDAWAQAELALDGGAPHPHLGHVRSLHDANTRVSYSHCPHRKYACASATYATREHLREHERVLGSEHNVDRLLALQARHLLRLPVHRLSRHSPHIELTGRYATTRV